MVLAWEAVSKPRDWTISLPSGSCGKVSPGWEFVVQGLFKSNLFNDTFVLYHFYKYGISIKGYSLNAKQNQG